MMTVEKAIRILEALWISEKVDYTDREVRDAIDMAIDALRAQYYDCVVSKKRGVIKWQERNPK